MFEKYHLIHIDINRNLTHQSPEGLSDKITVTDSSEENEAPENDALNFGAAEFSEFCINGSFDYLTPIIAKNQFTANVQPQLYIQSFCLMNNKKGYYTRRKDYPSILLSYTYSGEGRLIYKDETYNLTAGHGFLIDCRKSHEYATISESWEHLDIHIWGEQAVSLFYYFENQKIVSFPYPVTDFNTNIKKLLNAHVTYSEFRELYIGNEMSNILCDILHQAETIGKSYIPETYKYIVHYMECNYMHPLQLDELASLCNISKYHFCREFKKYTSYSPNDYLIMLRVQHACILLNSSDLSVEQIALEVGNENMSNFIYHFKKRTGMTPSTFRTKSRTKI